jgi:vacuolar-type H+-ATPase subunit I/STV1
METKVMLIFGYEVVNPKNVYTMILTGVFIFALGAALIVVLNILCGIYDLIKDIIKTWRQK